MPEDFLNPDAYQPEYDYEDDPAAMYLRNNRRAATGGFGLTGASLGVRPPAGAAASERTFFGTLDTRYATPNPKENVTPTAPTIAPGESPNRGGFNQAEGLARPDYSRGDELRRQAYELQHPSWWKKLVNGDEGLAMQAAHKYALAQYEDIAAQHKFRFDHPEAFQQPEKIEHLSPGTTAWTPSKGALYTAPEKPAKPATVHQFASGGKLWGRRDDSTEIEPIINFTNRPDDPGPNPDGSAGYTGRVGRQAEAEPTGSEFTTAFTSRDDEGNTTVGTRNRKGEITTQTFGATSKKTQPKGGGAGTGANKEWTPQQLEKAAQTIANKRAAARNTGDRDAMQETENDIKRMLNSGGLVEDELTGELSPRGKGASAKAIPDLKNPPNGTKRTDRETGKVEIFLRGEWKPFTGAGKGK